MRLPAIALFSLRLLAEPLAWRDIPAPVAKLLTEGGLTATTYSAWSDARGAAVHRRLDAGSAEHIAYFLLQTTSLAAGPPLDPVAEARRYLNSLPADDQRRFLGGTDLEASFTPAVQRRIDAFWASAPNSERHRILRIMADELGWPQSRVVQSAFRFLMKRSAGGDVDGLYQERGLSTDPFPASMRAVERGIRWMGSERGVVPRNVLLIGPGAEFGSRFGVDDAKPVTPPQPTALLSLLPRKPDTFDCVDIRREVTAVLAGGPCRAAIGDIAADTLPGARYDLAVATNIFVYLDDTELALALVNAAQALQPGGCLLHNDSRFAARLFGEAAGLPVVHFESVPLGRRNGREQTDRIVIHCKTKKDP